MRLMEWVYPNLRGKQFGKAMTGAFWLFVITTLILIATIIGIQAGTITPAVARVVEQGIGPIISINMVVLIYLADQNRRAVQSNHQFKT